jgi:hypothetical protein
MTFSAPTRSDHLATEHGNFMAEHDDFNCQFVAVSPAQAQQLEDSGECEVEKRQGHGPASYRMADSRKS